MPIITIFGATDTQGVVEGNLWDKESIKHAIRGSEAVFGTTNFWDPEIFPANPEGKGEITEGKNLVDAAREEGIEFFISSSLPSASRDSHGEFTKVQAHHLDRMFLTQALGPELNDRCCGFASTDKAAIQHYLQASGVPFAVLLTGHFPENLYK
ncbi:hypothetical protein R3P38DRAFT_2811039 [Favolaschia claudopus]|uniref:NmrA-like domain-containing protein n=1 Tax=Favolaschia claudopus TaxID=2862362 RepID=A0AAV9ZB94_9AGAR